MVRYTHTQILIFSSFRRCHYPKIPVSKRLLTHSCGVLNTVKITENTMFSLAELWVSEMTSHLYGNFNPNSFYILHLLIHIQNIFLKHNSFLKKAIVTGHCIWNSLEPHNLLLVLPLTSCLSLNLCHFLVPYLFASVRKRMRTIRPTNICNTLTRE